MKYLNQPVQEVVAADAAVAATMFAPRRFVHAASLPGCFVTRQTTRPIGVCAAAAMVYQELRLWWFSKIEKAQREH